MRIMLLALVLLSGSEVACAVRTSTAPGDSNLVVFVHWEGHGVADRRVEIVGLNLVQKTDVGGLATFRLPAGSHTLRAFVNVGGPRGSVDVGVTTKKGETQRVQVVDCQPCVSAH